MAKKNKKKSKKQPLKKKITKSANHNAKQLFDPTFSYLKRSKEIDKSDDQPILCMRKPSTVIVNKKKKKPVKGKGEKFTVPKVTLNPEQEETLQKMLDWWHDSSNQTFEITGAAGTGKTTLIRYLVAKLGLRKDEVLFTAYVGKATLAMTRNGLNAKTIHAAICTFSKNGKCCRDIQIVLLSFLVSFY
jgi:ATPase subunit of ABC transporter with duplicated ATPase domains